MVVTHFRVTGLQVIRLRLLGPMADALVAG